MLEIQGNIWDYLGPNSLIGITTNGFVKKNSRCVMGAGVAKQARDRFKDLDLELGIRINLKGNKVYLFWERGLFTFPVKHNWNEDADLELIEKSCEQLKVMMRLFPEKRFFLVRPGCLNGSRDWETEVKPIMLKHFSDQPLTIVEWKNG